MLRETINKFLSQVETDDQHIRASIIKRRKDNPGQINESAVLKRYTFQSIKDFDKHQEEIISICDLQNARFYVNPTVKSYRAIAYEFAAEAVRLLGQGEFKKHRVLYDSVADANTGVHGKRFWVVDLDVGEGHWNIDDVVQIYKEDGLYITHTKTKNGYHVVVKPYDSRKDTLSIKKNAHTLLYWVDVKHYEI